MSRLICIAQFQLRKSVREFYGLGDSYARLYQTAFDADPESLFNVEMYVRNNSFEVQIEFMLKMRRFGITLISCYVKIC
jgi:hypothetical protein